MKHTHHAVLFWTQDKLFCDELTNRRTNRRTAKASFNGGCPTKIHSIGHTRIYFTYFIKLIRIWFTFYFSKSAFASFQAFIQAGDLPSQTVESTLNGSIYFSCLSSVVPFLSYTLILNTFSFTKRKFQIENQQRMWNKTTLNLKKKIKIWSDTMAVHTIHTYTVCIHSDDKSQLGLVCMSCDPYVNFKGYHNDKHFKGSF